MNPDPAWEMLRGALRDRERPTTAEGCPCCVPTEDIEALLAQEPGTIAARPLHRLVALRKHRGDRCDAYRGADA